MHSVGVVWAWGTHQSEFQKKWKTRARDRSSETRSFGVFSGAHCCCKMSGDVPMRFFRKEFTYISSHCHARNSSLERIEEGLIY